MEWTGRKVLVTGASRGIGLETAQALTARGALVLATGRNPAALDDLLRRGIAMDVLEADLADPEIAHGICNWVADAHPDCSVLINNAAVMRYPVMTDGTDHCDAIAEEVQVNQIAAMQLAVGLLPVLSRRRDARIVNVTSGLAVAPKADAPIYCATKAAMRSFTRTLRYQCEDAGLDLKVCEALLPVVDTSLSRGAPERKMHPAEAAAAIIAGTEAGLPEIWIGKTRLLKRIMRLSPALAHGIMRRMEA